MNGDSEIVVDATDSAIAVVPEASLPPLLMGHTTGHTTAKVRSFYESIADIFERWVARSHSYSHSAVISDGDVLHAVGRTTSKK